MHNSLLQLRTLLGTKVTYVSYTAVSSWNVLFFGHFIYLRFHGFLSGPSDLPMVSVCETPSDFALQCATALTISGLEPQCMDQCRLTIWRWASGFESDKSTPSSLETIIW